MKGWDAQREDGNVAVLEMRRAFTDSKFVWGLVAAIFLAGSTYALFAFRVRSHDLAIAGLQRETTSALVSSTESCAGHLFGPGRRVTPHMLRHTFASLHLARGTNLKWVQEAPNGPPNGLRVVQFT